MMKLNLLPKWAIAEQTRKKHIKMLAVAQAAIFLLLAGLFMFLYIWESHVSTNISEIRTRLASFSPAYAQAAEQLQLARAIALEEEIFLEMMPRAFYIGYLLQILDATPQNATLTRIYYSGNGEITLFATTEALLTTETHRASLAFPHVWMGRITRTAGIYAYEIHISMRETE
jgi:hypothetical protein